MKKFAETAGFSYHVNGDFISRSDTFYIRVSSQYKPTRHPDELRKVVDLNLYGTELDALINELQNIRASKPSTLPKEEYNWLAGEVFNVPI